MKIIMIVVAEIRRSVELTSAQAFTTILWYFERTRKVIHMVGTNSMQNFGVMAISVSFSFCVIVFIRSVLPQW